MFSDMRPEVRVQLKNHRRILILAARRVMAIACRRRIPVRALADPDVEGSEALLKHFGFSPLAQGVWEWAP